jgi:hypothetical protein
MASVGISKTIREMPRVDMKIIIRTKPRSRSSQNSMVIETMARNPTPVTGWHR